MRSRIRKNGQISIFQKKYANYNVLYNFNNKIQPILCQKISFDVRFPKIQGRYFEKIEEGLISNIQTVLKVLNILVLI